MAYEIYGAERTGSCVVICDHACNHVPTDLQPDLGLPAKDMQRHIAYDIGAAGVTYALADLLHAPAVLSRFSRLVIDPNRDAMDPTVLMRIYDGSVIPGNRTADRAERDQRIAQLHAPYHDAIDRVMAARTNPILISVHSFTPQLRGRGRRPWEIGLLYADTDPRLSQALLQILRTEPDLCVGENQPYKGHLRGDSVDRHALRQRYHNTLIELRNDLIDTPERQQAWAERLAPLIRRAIAQAT